MLLCASTGPMLASIDPVLTYSGMITGRTTVSLTHKLYEYHDYKYKHSKNSLKLAVNLGVPWYLDIII